MQEASGSRLIFANQLRGLAALGVLASHLIGVFWAMRDFVGLATSSPPQDGPLPGLFRLVSFTWLNFGPLGVGVFFLISGLVIPISLERHTRCSFLQARLLRIFPTYLVAMAIDIFVVRAAGAYWGHPYPYGIDAILGNLTLTYNLFGQPSIDLVNWTLCIELKFYLLMLLLAPQIRRGSLTALFAVALAILAGNAAFALAGAPDATMLRALSQESVFLLFMLLGVLFNFQLRGLLSPARAIAAIAVMFALFVAAWRLSALGAQYPIVTVNYLYALALFGGCYLLRRHARPCAPIDALAAISFPLYLVHSMVGFLCLKIAMVLWGWPYPAALAASLVVVVVVASMLHRTVERRSISMGRERARAPAFG